MKKLITYFLLEELFSLVDFTIIYNLIVDCISLMEACQGNFIAMPRAL